MGASEHGAWEHDGNMGTWEHGDMGAWEHGSMEHGRHGGTWSMEHGAWEHGSTGAREHGSTGARERGTWEQGSMGARGKGGMGEGVGRARSPYPPPPKFDFCDKFFDLFIIDMNYIIPIIFCLFLGCRAVHVT